MSDMPYKDGFFANLNKDFSAVDYSKRSTGRVGQQIGRSSAFTGGVEMQTTPQKAMTRGHLFEHATPVRKSQGVANKENRGGQA